MTPPPDRRGRRPRIVFVEPAEAQVRGLSAEQTVMLDGALHAIGSDPGAVTPHATASALRDYRRGGVRVIFFATALGSILIVTYVEVD